MKENIRIIKLEPSKDTNYQAAMEKKAELEQQNSSNTYELKYQTNLGRPGTLRYLLIEKSPPQSL